MSSTGRRPRAWGRFTAGAIAVLTAWAFVATVAGAAVVTPTPLPGASNDGKNCYELIPGSEELKIEPVPDGAYNRTDGTLSVDLVKPSTMAGSVNSFDWASNIKVLGVVVKDGVDGANFYDYRPDGSVGDLYLTTPNAGDKGISHISFCYKPALTVTKTASATFTRTYTWEIDKAVTPASHVGFPGDTFKSDYDVTLTRTVTDSDFKVSGTVTVSNPSKKTVTFSVADSVRGTPVDVSCPTYTLAPGGSTECTYSASFTAMPDPSSGTNTATITSLTEGVDGAVATAPYAFGAPTTVVGYETVNVTDSVQGALGSASDSKLFEYTDDFACPTDKAQYSDGVYSYDVPNRATIDETGQYADAKVTVDCYLWEIEKTALGTYDDQYEWDITKTVKPESQSGFAGDTLEWTWSITWEKSRTGDINHAVSGVITVTNPAPIPLTVAVDDYLWNGSEIAATVDCDGEGGTMLTVPAKGSASCTYSAKPGSQLPNNTATATRKGVEMSTTVDVKWEKGSDIGLDAVISDSSHKAIPVDSMQPFTYTEQHVCSTDPQAYADGNGTYSGSAENTATISWTGGTDSSTAETTYDCYLWDVDKTANGTYNDLYEWDIDKTVKPASQTGHPGDVLEWTWSITWASEFVKEINHEVTGTITVTNPAPMPLTVDVADFLWNGQEVAATVTCDEGGTMLTVPAEDSASCTYTAKPGSRLPYNTATATRSGVSVWDTVTVSWVKGPDAGMDAVISDSNHVTIPVDSEQPFTYTDSHECSMDREDYGEETWSYSGKATNTAEIRWTKGSDSSTAETTYTCTTGFVDIVKTTNDVVDPTKDITFDLYEGLSKLETVGTLGDEDGQLPFQTALVPGDTYTVCESPVPAGYTFEISVNGGLVPTYAGPPGEPYPTGEIQCFDFLAPEKATVVFEVNNSYPGGAPRTPGYWKNWNTCTGGGQQYTAAELGGTEAGVYLLDDLLPQTVGNLLIGADDCQVGVYVLSAQWAVGAKAGKSASSDAAYELARNYLAANLNKDAGACVVPTTTLFDADGKPGGAQITFTQVMTDAQALLQKVGYDGDGDLLTPKSKSPDRAYALYLAGILDRYNNGLLCTGEPSH